MELPQKLLHALILLCLIPNTFAIKGLLQSLQPSQWTMSKPSDPLSLRVLTHNIRYATSRPFRGEKPWADRKQGLLNELIYHTQHIPESFICLQEALHVQMMDILSGLNDATAEAGDPSPWAYIGVGRDDGGTRGEYSPIFYRPGVWKLQHWETVWLSQTPDKPSKSWDAASIRIVTIGVFKHRATAKKILMLSTHLDDQGSRSRFEAAHIILDKIKDYLDRPCGKDIAGIVLSGDLNSEAHQEAYQVLTAANSSLVDSYTLIRPAAHYGDEITWTGFGYENEEPKRIDYILLGPAVDGKLKQTWTPRGYAVLPNRFEDGVFNSDHRAVAVDAVLG